MVKEKMGKIKISSKCYEALQEIKLPNETDNDCIVRLFNDLKRKKVKKK